MGNQRRIMWNKRNEVDGIAHDAAGMSRRDPGGLLASLDAFLTR